jgi:hypothetical protein
MNLFQIKFSLLKNEKLIVITHNSFNKWHIIIILIIIIIADTC